MSDFRACEGCGARIEFRKGPTGKWLPVQRVRNVYVLRPNGDLAVLEFTNRPALISHFETCPTASALSKGSGSREALIHEALSIARRVVANHPQLLDGPDVDRWQQDLAALADAVAALDTV